MMERKFYTMFASGTLGIAIVSLALMSGTLIAGAMLNMRAVEAITLVSPLYSFSAFFAFLVSSGFPIVYSQAVGSMDKGKALRLFGTGLLTAIVMGIILFILLWLFGESYLRIYHPSEELLALALKYLFWLRFAVLLLPLLCLINAAVYADGDATIYNIAGISQLAATFLFGFLFCHFFGIAGISLGFFLSFIVSIIVSFLHLVRKKNMLRINFSWSYQGLLSIMKYSILDAGANLFHALFTFTMNIFVTRFFGDDFIVLVSAVSLVREFQMLLNGVGQGASPVIGTYLGEKSYAGVKNIYRIAERMALIMGLLFTVLIIAFAFSMPHLLSVTDPALSVIVTNGARILGITTVFVSFLFWLESYDVLAGHISQAVIATALRDVVLSAPLAILFSYLSGSVYGFFAGLCIAPPIVWAGSLLHARLKHGKENRKLLLEGNTHDSFLFSLNVTPQEIVKTRNEAEAVLKNAKFDPKTIFRTSLLIEELFMLVYEKNSTPVQGECCLNLSKHVELIVRDNGQILDLTDPDLPVSSLRDYLVSSYVDNMAYQRNNVTAIGFNRNHFVITFH